MGSTHAGQRVRGHQRLAAGDDRDGGAARICSTGNNSIRGLHLRVPGSEAHPLGVVVGAGVAGKVAGDEVQRGSSSGMLGIALQSTGGGDAVVCGLMGSC